MLSCCLAHLHIENNATLRSAFCKIPLPSGKGYKTGRTEPFSGEQLPLKSAFNWSFIQSRRKFDRNALHGFDIKHLLQVQGDLSILFISSLYIIALPMYRLFFQDVIAATAKRMSTSFTKTKHEKYKDYCKADIKTNIAFLKQYFGWPYQPSSGLKLIRSLFQRSNVDNQQDLRPRFLQLNFLSYPVCFSFLDMQTPANNTLCRLRQHFPERKKVDILGQLPKRSLACV